MPGPGKVSVGIDVVDLDRFEDLLKRHGERAKNRFFTPYERNYCEGRKGGEFACFAGKFAAKEAFLKALGTGLAYGIRWKDIEVRNDKRGTPYLELSGKASALLGGRKVAVSISHSKSTAVAVSMIFPSH